MMVEVRGALATPTPLVEVRGAPATPSPLVEVQGALATPTPLVEVQGALATSLETKGTSNANLTVPRAGFRGSGLAALTPQPPQVLTLVEVRGAPAPVTLTLVEVRGAPATSLETKEGPR